MGKILFSLAFATALLALASSEASAFLYSSFVCQAVGARSVGWGRSFFVGEAKVIALSRCARRSGICTISYCVPGYCLLGQATPECPCEIDGSEETIGQLSWVTKRPFGGHPTCGGALFLVKRQATRRAAPTLQATKRADLPSTAHLCTRE